MNSGELPLNDEPSGIPAVMGTKRPDFPDPPPFWKPEYMEMYPKDAMLAARREIEKAFPGGGVNLNGMAEAVAQYVYDYSLASKNVGKRVMSNMADRSSDLDMVHVLAACRKATDYARELKPSYPSTPRRPSSYQEALQFQASRPRKYSAPGNEQHFAAGGHIAKKTNAMRNWVVPHKSTGGEVPQAPGVPLEADEVQIKAQAGEVMVRNGPSQIYRQQLDDMNAGRVPHFKKGGPIGGDLFGKERGPSAGPAPSSPLGRERRYSEPNTAPSVPQRQPPPSGAGAAAQPSIPTAIHADNVVGEPVPVAQHAPPIPVATRVEPGAAMGGHSRPTYTDPSNDPGAAMGGRSRPTEASKSNKIPTAKLAPENKPLEGPTTIETLGKWNERWQSAKKAVGSAFDWNQHQDLHAKVYGTSFKGGDGSGSSGGGADNGDLVRAIRDLIEEMKSKKEKGGFQPTLAGAMPGMPAGGSGGGGQGSQIDWMAVARMAAML